LKILSVDRAIVRSTPSVSHEHFNAKVGRENIFQPTVGTKSVHPESNDNGIRLVNFTTSKNLMVKSTKFPHRNIQMYTWTSPDGITHIKIDHVLVDKRRQSSIIDVCSLV
jgi:hypothetical protein